MGLNFNQIAMLQKLKNSVNRFRSNHPKFLNFLNAVCKDAMEEGSVMEVTVTSPEGKKYTANLKLNSDDIELFEMLRKLNG